MTAEQGISRRAADYGTRAVIWINYPNARGYAITAATLAFLARPELRETLEAA